MRSRMRWTVSRSMRLNLTPVIAAALVTGGCQVTEPNAHASLALELSHRHAQWVALNIPYYSFDYDFAGFADRPPARIEVRADTIYRVVNRLTGAVITDPRGYPTIDDVFETAAEVIRNSDFDPRIQYNTRYGFPARIDAGSPNPDQGFGITISNFTDQTYRLQD